MRIWIKPDDGPRVPAYLPYAEARYVLVSREDAQAFHAECVDHDGLSVQGGTPTIGHNTYTCKAFCACCRQPLGVMTVRVSTLFGIEEDDRVLNGRFRVY